jgi:hypothetical protein
MGPPKPEPVAAAADGARKARNASYFDQLPGKIEIDATPHLETLQAARLVRKFGLTPPVARVVASLVFGEAAP